MEKELLYDLENSISKEIEDISEYIFEHPELGEQEFESSKYLVDVLRNNGFTVEYPYLDIATAFRAELKCGSGPKVAFLAEYDALPGYGPNKNENAHACGHNWIAGSSLGAALTLSLMKEHIHGTIVVIGTPAEETVGGKCDLVDRGAFNDIDAVLQMHLSNENNIDVKTLAMDSLEFEFHGVASHAAAYPELGINALDAVQLMFAGVNALRQHMRSDARVAGNITEGGKACNIVPDYAACRFYIRAGDRQYLSTLTEKIINCAKGAALMTGARMEYDKFENSYDNMVYDEELRSLLKYNLKQLDIVDFVDTHNQASGSSDIGNVSQVCPTCYCELALGVDAHVHHESILPYVHGEYSHKTLHVASKALAATAYDVFNNKLK